MESSKGWNSIGDYGGMQAVLGVTLAALGQGPGWLHALVSQHVEESDPEDGETEHE